MKKILVSTMLMFLIVSNVFAEAGAPIPKPEISLSEASQIAMDYFSKNEIEDEYFKIKDYFIISAVYQFAGTWEEQLEGWTGDNNKEYLENIKNKWGWKIVIVHPIANDITIAFMIKNNKEVIELERTE